MQRGVEVVGVSALLLCSLAMVFFAGALVVIVPVVMVALLGLRLSLGTSGGSVWHWVAVVLASLGGAIGVWSAAYALLHAGGAAVYHDRIGFGALALLCAALATAAGIAGRSRRAAGLIVLASLVGGIAINLFYINTFYIAAVLLWWLSAFAMLLMPAISAGGTARVA